jgi:hypothetical protein
MELTFDQWIEIGVKQKFCSPPYCENHDSVHSSDGEHFMDLVEEYESRDFCWSIVHIYEPHGING